MNALLAVMLLVANVQDTSDTRTLLRLEDDWARALVRRDTAAFQRLLAPGFVYTQDDRTMTRDQGLHEDGSASGTGTAAPNQDVDGDPFRETAHRTGSLV